MFTWHVGKRLRKRPHLLIISYTCSIESALTLPQSLWLEELAEAIFAFFLLSFSFSPARTTSFVSLRQAGQYLVWDEHAELIQNDSLTLQTVGICMNEEQNNNNIKNIQHLILLTSPRPQGWRWVGGSGSKCDRPCHIHHTGAVCRDPAWCRRCYSYTSDNFYRDRPCSACTLVHLILEISWQYRFHQANALNWGDMSDSRSTVPNCSSSQVLSHYETTSGMNWSLFLLAILLLSGLSDPAGVSLREPGCSIL